MLRNEMMAITARPTQNTFVMCATNWARSELYSSWYILLSLFV